jgi:hypothetical protein
MLPGVPPNTVSNLVFIGVHDFQRGDRALVPALNFAQDGINILGHGELAQSGIGDRYRIWCNLVGEISPSRSLHGHVGFESDFIAHIRELSGEFQQGASGASAFGSTSVERSATTK